MRYSQYKTINELSESLNEALNYVADTKNYALLEDCLMAMTAISDALLNEPGKEADKAKSILADMYKILEILNNPEDDIPKLANFSGALANECKTNLKYKLRILFVAELGSKWDSMKSVYEAFLERDDCDIDVVLEPIFRATQLPNGETKAEIIYDDWLTPLGINHIPYKEYDMATIQPDITFISQPYESVTIPMFWPENIAKYSKLVYVPYYAARALNNVVITSFFKMKAEGYAWKIVCQSNKMKEYYEQFSSRKGDNVLVTGLPKWDYPLSLSKKNTPCPESWKEKLTNRKVFLLNTHFSTPIRQSEDLDIISFFINRDDVALIWRPHPMTETVAKVYNENQYKDFLELKNTVMNSKNTIFDDHDSYAFSFVWSDALISEYSSSMVSQYLFMKKPIATFVKKPEGEEGTLIDFSKMPRVCNESDLIEFVEAVTLNSHFNERQMQMLIKGHSLPIDTTVGKIVADSIVEEYLKI